MAKMIIKHNGFIIKMGQKGEFFIYTITGPDNKNIVSGHFYVGDGDKLNALGQDIKRLTGLDIEIDSN